MRTKVCEDRLSEQCVVPIVLELGIKMLVNEIDDSHYLQPPCDWTGLGKIRRQQHVADPETSGPTVRDTEEQIGGRLHRLCQADLPLTIGLRREDQTSLVALWIQEKGC